jgi:hypothetical protein
VPPARVVGLSGQVEELGAFRLVAHPVEGEQVGDVALLEADASQLETADLRGRGADRFPGLLAGDARRLPLAAQRPAETDPQDGRPRRPALISRRDARRDSRRGGPGRSGARFRDCDVRQIAGHIAGHCVHGWTALSPDCVVPAMPCMRTEVSTVTLP